MAKGAGLSKVIKYKKPGGKVCTIYGYHNGMYSVIHGEERNEETIEKVMRKRYYDKMCIPEDNSNIWKAHELCYHLKEVEVLEVYHGFTHFMKRVEEMHTHHSNRCTSLGYFIWSMKKYRWLVKEE